MKRSLGQASQLPSWSRLDREILGNSYRPALHKLARLKYLKAPDVGIRPFFFDETMREEILEISPQKKQELAAKSNEYP